MYLPEPLYDDPTLDLWTYDGTGAGWPTGWNLAHPLLELADELGQLEAFASIGVAPRTVTLTEPTFTSASVGIPVPGSSDPRVLVNHYNPRYPTLTHVAPRLAIGAMHFWDAVQYRNRPSSSGLWSAPTIRTMDLDGTLRTRANADYLGTYNQLAGVQKAQADCGLAEYGGASPAAGPFFPLFRAGTAPPPYAGWLIERNGRALEVTVEREPFAKVTPANVAAWRVNLPAGAALYPGDSGGIVLLEIEGRLGLLGHVTYGNLPATPYALQFAYATAATVPDESYLESVADPAPEIVTLALATSHALATTLAEASATAAAIRELLEP